MKKTKTVRALLLACMVGATLAATGCSVMQGQQSAGSYVDDATITANVKTKLFQDKAVNAGSVNVQTLHGEVMLSGFVKSDAERLQAARDARGVSGVRAVRNNLVVRSATQ